MNLQEMIAKLEHFGRLRVKKDKLEAQLEVVDKEIEAEQPILVDLMQKLKMQNMTVKKLGIFYLETKSYPNVKDDRLMRTWLRKNSMGEIIKETVNYQTLRSLCNERLKANEEIPEGVEVFMKTQVKLRRK